MTFFGWWRVEASEGASQFELAQFDRVESPCFFSLVTKLHISHIFSVPGALKRDREKKREKKREKERERETEKQRNKREREKRKKREREKERKRERHNH